MLAHLLHARIFHYPLVGSIANFLGRILDPTEHDRLVDFGLHCAFDVGDLPVSHVVAPTLDDACCAELLEDRGHLCGLSDKILLLACGYGNQKTIDITLGYSP